MNKHRDHIHDDAEAHGYDLAALDNEERKLVRELISFAEQHSDAHTAEYRNYYVRRVGDFYEARGLSRSEIIKTTVWQIAQSISGRLLVASGLARDSDDYREKLNELIRTKYGSRRRFCEATGVSEDMLSHVLSKRKHLSIPALTDALARIGYTLDIVPLPESK